MTNNAIVKAAAVSGGEQTPTEAELALINAYTRRKLGADEVYVFSVALCDNDVDRDGERFTVESLFALEKLFVGKTGIFDHSASAKNQVARIFACCVEQISGRKTATGDDYFRLTARAYIPVNEGSRALIEAIDGGIVKEVSVGCAVSETKCSICGQDIAVCPHQKGETYGGRLCCGELTEPVDAYEWSFVAVPAQREAGVIKSFERKERSMEDIIKQLKAGKSLTLSDGECEKLSGYIESLKQSAKDGVYYRESLVADVLRLSAAVQPDVSRGTMEDVAKSMSVAQLREFKNAFEKQKNREYAPKPQLCGSSAVNSAESFGQFTI